jgi:hypothetical protein
MAKVIRTCVSKALSRMAKQNVEVEWLTLMLCIEEVPGSNLDRKTGYPD